MREIVKLINKKDLEEIIELNFQLKKFYKDMDDFSLSLLPDGGLSCYIKNKIMQTKLRARFVNNFFIFIDLDCATIDGVLEIDPYELAFNKQIDINESDTAKDFAKYVSQIIDEFNKEQDFFTFIWGDEEWNYTHY